MPITPLQQPKRSRLCGQTCVAMVANISLDDCIERVFKGHRRGTTVAHLVAALRKLKIKCHEGLQLVQDDTVFPRVYIAQMKRPGHKNWHWVLFADGAIYDPMPDSDLSGLHINAFLEIKL